MGRLVGTLGEAGPTLGGMTCPSAPSSTPEPTVEGRLVQAALRLALRALDDDRPPKAPDGASLARAGLAGAAAALTLELTRAIMKRSSDAGGAGLPAHGALERVIRGAASGMVYALEIEPRAPGPRVLKGVIHAAAEHVARPAGGLAAVLPDPGVSALAGFFSEVGRHDPRLAERVAMGVAVALVYRPSG